MPGCLLFLLYLYFFHLGTRISTPEKWGKPELVTGARLNSTITSVSPWLHPKTQVCWPFAIPAIWVRANSLIQSHGVSLTQLQ